MITRKKVSDFGYDSLEGKDLKGKYINLALVVDTTGSMSGIINSVRDTLKEFVNAITETKATLRIALIDYRDIEEDGDSSTVLHQGSTYSIWFENSNIDELKEQIDHLGADGGGDEPESVVDALGNLVKPDIMTFNASAAKFAFLVTDASYKEGNNHGIDGMNELTQMLKEKDIATSVITMKSNYSYYRELAEKTGGILINVEDDFSNAMGRFALSIAEKTEDYIPDPDFIPVESITLGSDLTVPEGKLKNFKPSFKPSNATKKDVLWEVENPEIAEISKDKTTEEILVVRGIKEGKTKIIARSMDGGYTASFDFSVTKFIETENSIETCNIEDITNELISDNSTVKDFTYYGDVNPEINQKDQTEIYRAISQKDKNISFVFNSNIGSFLYQWKFEGKEISSPDTSLNFNISINDINSEAKASAEKTFSEYVTLDFQHEGLLPGKAEVSIMIGSVLPDGQYDLYYYNDTSDNLELCENKVVISKGVATFQITHCSSYVIGHKNDGSSITNPSGGPSFSPEPVVTSTPQAPTPSVTPTPEPPVEILQATQNIKLTYDSKGKRLKREIGSTLIQSVTGAKTAITFESSNPKVAKVGKTSGVISCISVGKAVITTKAAASNKYKAAEKHVTIYVVPKTAKIKSIKSNKKGKVTIKSSKATKGNDGYQIQYKHDGKTKKLKVKSRKSLNKTLNNLKTGKPLKARIRAYKKADGKTYYGSYSSWKTVRKVK